MAKKAKSKLALISLGCSKNLVNSEQMLFRLDEAGYEIVTEPDKGDVAVVNTCGFIESAKQEAIDTIIQLGELKKKGSLKAIVATGCLSQRYGENIKEDLPEVDAILGTGSYDNIVEAVESVLEGKRYESFGDINAPIEECGRIVSTGPSYAYLRIAEGCNNCCAYCAIPSIRGRYRSRGMEDIVEEAGALAQTGIKELIVVAQDVTRYGIEIYGKRSLSELLRRLCRVDGIEWIRLHYLYPDEFDRELIETIAKEDKIVKYLDIPLQHINDGILKRMNRRGSSEEIRELLAEIRQGIPGAAIRTSIIVGLPGEGEEEFEELCDFLREARIERAGVFVFSPEEGTPAADMTDRCDEIEAARRQQVIMKMQAEIMDEWGQGFVGETLRVLCDGYNQNMGMQFGRSYADSPDVDGMVFFSGECSAGEFAEVQIDEIECGDWYGHQVR